MGALTMTTAFRSGMGSPRSSSPNNAGMPPASGTAVACSAETVSTSPGPKCKQRIMFSRRCAHTLHRRTWVLRFAPYSSTK